MTPSISEASKPQATLQSSVSNAPGEVGAFRQDLLGELARQLWPRGIAIDSPAGPNQPQVAKKSKAGSANSEDSNVRLGVALDPTAAAAALLNSPASHGISELAKPAAERELPGDESRLEEKATPRREENARREAREVKSESPRATDSKQAEPRPAEAGRADARPAQQTPGAAQPERSDVGVSGPQASSSAPVPTQQSGQVPAIAGAGRAVSQPASPVNATPAGRAVVGPGGASKNAATLLKSLDRPSTAPRFVREQDETLSGQLVRGLASILRQKGGAVTIRLNPEALGAVKVKLEIDQASVRARFEASSEEARRLLSESSETLRHALEARGLSVEKLEIVSAEPRTVDGATSSPHQNGLGTAGGEFGRSDNPAHGTGDRGHGRPGFHPPHGAGDEASELLGAGGGPTIQLLVSGGTLRLDALA